MKVYWGDLENKHLCVVKTERVKYGGIEKNYY